MLCVSDGQWSENTTVSCKGQYYGGWAGAINFQSKEVARGKKVPCKDPTRNLELNWSNLNFFNQFPFKEVCHSSNQP